MVESSLKALDESPVGEEELKDLGEQLEFHKD
jgi:hypothetical protein